MPFPSDCFAFTRRLYLPTQCFFTYWEAGDKATRASSIPIPTIFFGGLGELGEWRPTNEVNKDCVKKKNVGGGGGAGAGARNRPAEPGPTRPHAPARPPSVRACFELRALLDAPAQAAPPNRNAGSCIPASLWRRLAAAEDLVPRRTEGPLRTTKDHRGNTSGR
jgi:hypothetical protein